MASQQNKLREQMAKSFIDALQQDQLPWKACWQTPLPENATNGKKYRGINSLMLSYVASQAGYADSRWCTFKQASEKGWKIRKGSKGAPVEYWAYYDKEAKKLLSWQDAKKIIRDDPDYAAQNLQLRSRVYTVFNGEQIEGIPERNHKPEISVEDILKKRDTLLQNMDLKIREGGSQPYYEPTTDTVCMPVATDFFDQYAYACTLLHECSHATGHETRLNRALTAGFGTSEYAKEELRAEIASAFTAQALGIQLSDAQLEDHMVLHKAYIQSWAADLSDAPAELFKAIKDAETISDYLIDKGEFRKERYAVQEVSPELDYVGRIDFLSFRGTVMESIEYKTAGEMIRVARDECHAGAPICLTLYKDKNGNHISTDFIKELNPPPKQLSFEDRAPEKKMSLNERLKGAEMQLNAMQQSRDHTKGYDRER